MREHLVQPNSLRAVRCEQPDYGIGYEYLHVLFAGQRSNRLAPPEFPQ